MSGLRGGGRQLLVPDNVWLSLQLWEKLFVWDFRGRREMLAFPFSQQIRVKYCKKRFRNIWKTNYSILSTYRGKITYVTFSGTLAMSHITKILLWTYIKKRPSAFMIHILILPRYHSHCSSKDHKPDSESCWVPTNNFNKLQEEI